jgi:hypothetical protein
MSPEERELLRRSIALAEENNDILRSIQSSMRFARFMSILYWVIIIGASFGAYYLIQPYIDTLMSVYGGAKGQIDGAGNGLGDLMNKFRELSN